MFDLQGKWYQLATMSLEQIMADLSKLQNDVATQTGLIQTLVSRVADLKNQNAGLSQQVTALQASLANAHTEAAAAAAVIDQGSVDAIGATVQGNNAAITAASS